MLRARVGLVWLVGLSLAIVGCGKPTDDPRLIVDDFRESLDAGRQKYKGKTVRVEIEKVTKVEESPSAVNIQGNTGKFIILASFADAADKTKALALKSGDSVTVEGEVNADPGGTPGRGVLYISRAKIAP